MVVPYCHSGLEFIGSIRLLHDYLRKWSEGLFFLTLIIHCFIETDCNAMTAVKLRSFINLQKLQETKHMALMTYVDVNGVSSTQRV